MNQLNAVQSSVNTVSREAFAGVAAAMAMPNLTPSAPGKTVVAAGGQLQGIHRGRYRRHLSLDEQPLACERGGCVHPAW